MPIRKKLLSLLIGTVGSSAKKEENSDSINTMELSAEATRKELITNRKRDKMNMKQPKDAQDSHINDKIQCAFKNLDDE